jgi:hypothetical protein
MSETSAVETRSSLRDFQLWTAEIHQRADGENLEPRGSLVCATLGLCGELGELGEPDADELIEAGDVLSYAFLAAELCELDASLWLLEEQLDLPEDCVEAVCETAVFPREELLNRAVRHGMAFAELMKKELFQGKPQSKELKAWCLSSVVRFVAAYVGANGCSLRQVILANTIKLESRYPSAKEG